MFKNKIKTIFFYMALLIVLGNCLGCHSDPWHAYKETLRSGQKVIPWVKSVDALVDAKNVDHFITHYGFDRSSPCDWQTVIYFYGHYRMQIVQKVSIDYFNNRVTGTVGDMKIVINEVKEIKIKDREASYGQQARFGAAEWEKFEKSGGDFTVFPMKIVQDQPIPDFEEYRKGWGKDIIKP